MTNKVITDHSTVQVLEGDSITNYIAQAHSIGSSKNIIEAFLRKYVGTTDDKKLFKRTIDKLEASRLNGILLYKNMHSKISHINRFFEYIGRRDMSERFSKWKKKIRKTDKKMNI
jgi:hypothetical protein